MNKRFTNLVLIIFVGFVLNVSAQTNLNILYHDEQKLTDAIPQLFWSQDYLVSNGWMKPGQVLNAKANYFSNKHYKLFDLTGEVQFLYSSNALCDFSFYIQDGEVGSTNGDYEFAKLYKAIKQICPNSEARSGDGKSSEISWRIVGMSNTYNVKLTRRVFKSTIERGLEISIEASNTAKK